MSNSEIAKQYLTHFEKGNIQEVVDLFSLDGLVDSPIYGVRKADDFYRTLNNDTSNSELHLKGIFE